MLDLMGVVLAQLKIEDTDRSPHHDNGQKERDQPGWALKQTGHLLQVIGTKMTSLGERLGHESDSALTTPLTAQD